MRKVTRYALNEDVATGTHEISPVPDSFEGPFVSYEDYAALELLKEQYLNNWAKAEKKNSSLEVTCDELEARVKELEGRVTAHIVDRKRASEDKARLEEELARLKAQQPSEYQYYYHNHGTGTGEWLRVTNKQFFEKMKVKHAGDNDFSFRELFTRAVPAEPRPAVLQEWTDEQCLDFMSVAFRHAEISGDIEMDDIRLGMKIVNAGREIAE